MKCPFCNYEFYTLRNAVQREYTSVVKGKVDPSRIARKLWLNCPTCDHDFPAWVQFTFDPENSLAYRPNEQVNPPVLE